MYFCNFVANSAWKSNNDKLKFVAFLVFVCTTASFIAQTFVFRKCLETGSHLGSGRKTVNSQGYSELLVVNTNTRYFLD